MIAKAHSLDCLGAKLEVALWGQSMPRTTPGLTALAAVIGRIQLIAGFVSTPKTRRRRLSAGFRTQRRVRTQRALEDVNGSPCVNVGLKLPTADVPWLALL